MILVDAKFDADLINISEVTIPKTKWPRFFGLPCIMLYVVGLLELRLLTSRLKMTIKSRRAYLQLLQG